MYMLFPIEYFQLHKEKKINTYFLPFIHAHKHLFYFHLMYEKISHSIVSLCYKKS